MELEKEFSNVIKRNHCAITDYICDIICDEDQCPQINGVSCIECMKYALEIILTIEKNN